LGVAFDPRPQYFAGPGAPGSIIEQRRRSYSRFMKIEIRFMMLSSIFNRLQYQVRDA
jgi:hypothetical protein